MLIISVIAINIIILILIGERVRVCAVVRVCMCSCVQCNVMSASDKARFLACRYLYGSGIRTQLVTGQGICNLSTLTGCSRLLNSAFASR
jgi:hypothetical protein